MSIARGLTKAAKAAKKQSRGLTGNRNSQGDFMPEEVQMKGVQKSVEPDIQNYINDVKKQIDEIENKIEDQEVYVQELTLNQEISPDDVADLDALYAQKFQLFDDLITKLEDNNIPVPSEVRELQLSPAERDLEGRYDAMRRAADEQEAREQEIARAYNDDPDPTGGWAMWNS